MSPGLLCEFCTTSDERTRPGNDATHTAYVHVYSGNCSSFAVSAARNRVAPLNLQVSNTSTRFSNRTSYCNFTPRLHQKRSLRYTRFIAYWNHYWWVWEMRGICIQYTDRCLKKYSQAEKEWLAFVYGVMCFHSYLFGHHFKLPANQS